MIENKKIIWLVIIFILLCVVGAYVYDHKEEYFDNFLSPTGGNSFYSGFPGRY